MLWVVRGFGAFALSYALVDRFGKGRNKRSLQNESFYRTSLRYTVYVLACIGWIAILSWITNVIMFGFSLSFIEGDFVADDSVAGTLKQMLILLSAFRSPFILCFIVLYFFKKTDRHLHFIFGILLLITVIDIIVIGSKEAIIRPMVVGLLALAFVPLKFDIKKISIGLLALITVYGSFTVITEYRAIMLAESEAGFDVFNLSIQSDAFVTALIRSLPFSETLAHRQTRVDEKTVLARFGAGMYSFSNIMEFTEHQPPYDNAWESFLIPVYSIVPRSLTPNKPNFFNSGRNAKEYYGWSYGGISVTLLGSFYYAWGYMGIIFGMAFIGGILAYVVVQVRLWSIYSPHWLIIYSSLIMPMLDVGVTFQVIYSPTLFV